MRIKQRFDDFVRMSRAGDTSPELLERLFGSVFRPLAVLVVLGAVLTGSIMTQSWLPRILQLASLLLLAGVWYLWRVGRVTLATYILVWCLWGLVTLVVLSESGRASHWLVPQVLLVVMARFLLNSRMAIVMALVTALTDFLIYSLRLSRFLPQELRELAFGNDWPAILISFLFLIVIFFLADAVLRFNLLGAQRNEGRYRSLFDHTNDAVFLIDRNLHYAEVNKQAAALLGYQPEELKGKAVFDVVAPTEVASMKANFKRVEREGMIPLFERTMIRKDGSRIIAEVNVSAISDENGDVLYHQSVMRDITERKRLEDQLRYSLEEMEALAMQDSLTGLLNRRAVSEHAEAEWFRSQRENRPMCVVLIDLDNLKKINDTQGHSSGDQIILELARAIKTQKRRYDWGGRWGGDEFLLVLPGTTLVDAGEIAERLRSQYTQGEAVRAFGEYASVSMGVACYSGRPGDEVSLDRLLTQADEALYQAKQEGKNRVHLYRDPN